MHTFTVCVCRIPVLSQQEPVVQGQAQLETFCISGSTASQLPSQLQSGSAAAGAAIGQNLTPESVQWREIRSLTCPIVELLPEHHTIPLCPLVSILFSNQIFSFHMSFMER